MDYGYNHHVYHNPCSPTPLGKRMHNLCCDNCHSHVARALNLMNYDGKSR